MLARSAVESASNNDLIPQTVVTHANLQPALRFAQLSRDFWSSEHTRKASVLSLGVLAW